MRKPGNSLTTCLTQVQLFYKGRFSWSVVLSADDVSGSFSFQKVSPYQERKRKRERGKEEREGG